MLARAHRIVEGDDLRRISRRGSHFRCSLFIASREASGAGDPARVGVVTSKKVGGAVTRNRVKRRLRALAAQTLRSHPRGYGIVVRAHSDAARATFDELSSAWSEMEGQLIGS